MNRFTYLKKTLPKKKADVSEKTMPKKKAKKRGKKMDVPITDKSFFVKLGSRGGNATKRNHDEDYYRRICILAHHSRNERKAERLAELAAQQEREAARVKRVTARLTKAVSSSGK